MSISTGANPLREKIRKNPRKLKALAEVAHYNREYGAPASTADVAFEMASGRKEDKVIERTYHKGMRETKPLLKSLKRDKLVRQPKVGGWLVTSKGKSVFGRDTEKIAEGHK